MTRTRIPVAIVAGVAPLSSVPRTLTTGLCPTSDVILPRLTAASLAYEDLFLRADLVKLFSLTFCLKETCRCELLSEMISPGLRVSSSESNKAPRESQIPSQTPTPYFLGNRSDSVFVTWFETIETECAIRTEALCARAVCTTKVAVWALTSHRTRA